MAQSILGTAATFAFTIAASLAPAFAATAAPRPADRLKACHLEGIAEELRCGAYPVWEDRAAKRGRKIDLNIVLLPALGADPAPDPIFYFDGGPGAGAAEGGIWLAQEKALRQRHDVVLVDQRGTGHSHPLNCDLYGPDSHAKGGEPKLLAGDLFPPDKVRQCRDQLEKTSNLKLYTTALAMDDVDEVRAWLGYDKIILFGGSYGTRAAQVYLQRHPRSVRSAVLDGVAPLDEMLPLHHAYAGKRAVDLLFADCAAQPACHAAFPHPDEELKAVLERVDRGVKVQIPAGAAGGTVEVTASRGLIAEGIRFMMYGSTARNVPLAVHQAYEGDLSQLVSLAADRRADLDHALSIGLLFSVTCAEDIPYIDDATAARETAGTLLGDYRIREQKRACAIWPRGSAPANVHELVHSDVPVLLLSGERDPVTPPEFGARVASHLSNSLHVVFPGGAHGADSPCAQGIRAAFVERGSVQGLDTSCVAKAPPTVFTLKPHVVVQLEPKLLDAYAGTYQFDSFAMTVSHRGDHLYAAAAGQPEIELFPEAEGHVFAKAFDGEFDFVRDPDGVVRDIVMRASGQEVKGKRIK
jgi:pimeloyl-ACP methyl ester carboxylesterase